MCNKYKHEKIEDAVAQIKHMKSVPERKSNSYGIYVCKQCSTDRPIYHITSHSNWNKCIRVL